MQPAGSTDDELLDRARRNDQDAFRALVGRYEATVAATVVGMLGRGADADDVGQETFILFFRSLGAFRGDSTIGTYLTRIAINQSLKALKRRSKWAQRFFSRDAVDFDVADPVVEGSLAVDDRERAELVQRALLGIPDDHRAVVVLRVLEGYSTKETAVILGVPQGTVTSRLSRALEKLEKSLGPLIDS